MFYLPWCGFLNMWLIGHLLGHKVAIFEMSKSCWFFLTPQISEFWAINWHRCVTICKLKCCFLFYFFRWFKFTLKPPYSGASERTLLAIWDTSHWNFFVKFGLRTAWDISYDILLSLLKFVNFWRLQGHLSILAKIGCLQKIKVFLMKERWGFNVTWGF